MNKQLSLLVELQKLDSIILSTRLRINAIPATILSHKGPLRNAEEAYENTKQQGAALEVKKKNKEQNIEEISERIKKLRQRTSEIKTNKEYQAHLKEIGKAEKELKTAEDELLSLIDSIDGLDKVIEIEKERITEEKTRMENIKNELEREVARCEEELKKLKGSRKKLTEKIDADIYNEYINIMKTRGGLAVVETKDEACQGCNMHIPPQLFVEIKTGSEIFHCPQCRRILYYAEEERQTAGSTQ